MPFEKKLNIVSGNGYFSKKKKEYMVSKIAITNTMGTSEVMEWDLDSIMKRDLRISDEMAEIFARWNSEYLNFTIDKEKADVPSEEDLAQIEEFKRKGWI